jgi:hypothetical protein
MRKKSCLFRLLLGLWIAGALALGQETRASLSGIVSDSSGSVVPGAALELTNAETGFVLTAAGGGTPIESFLGFSLVTGSLGRQAQPPQ